MKKIIIILTALIISSFLIINFASFKPTQTTTHPVSSIENGTLNSLKINDNGNMIKASIQGYDFILIKDPVVGSPDGSFNLIKKVNVFGFTKYEATMEQKQNI